MHFSTAAAEQKPASNIAALHSWSRCCPCWLIQPIRLAESRKWCCEFTQHSWHQAGPLDLEICAWFLPILRTKDRTSVFLLDLSLITLAGFGFPFLAYITSSSRQNVVRKYLTARNKKHTVPGSAETSILRLSHQNHTHLCSNWFKKCLVARMESSTKATSSKWSFFQVLHERFHCSAGVHGTFTELQWLISGATNLTRLQLASTLQCASITQIFNTFTITRLGSQCCKHLPILDCAMEMSNKTQRPKVAIRRWQDLVALRHTRKFVAPGF